ncbi:Geraniol 8-hydroxylase [Camellia lanceoleosa]|uniref:Geraniol 8-hydroxylase n=1 Tax=Camellia lanceoleosa TaxID=1840588 RepID=A0ACC0IYL6_9ERIC|nr:Geraniol 8-hydroxylase [Camellia lanceoleosa]
MRQQKVAELVYYARKCGREGVAVDIGRAGFRTSMNVLWNTIFSEDFSDPSQDTGKEFKDMVWNIMAEASRFNLVDFFPAVAKMDPQGIRQHMTNVDVSDDDGYGAWSGEVVETFNSFHIF